MKSISIRQPWASLIACGAKTVETRTWETKYRGPLLIVAGKAVATDDQAKDAGIDRFRIGWANWLPRGMAVAIVELYDIKTMSREHEKAALVKARPGLFAWYLRGARPIDHFPVTGKLGLFDALIPEEMNGDLSRMPG